MNILKKLYVFLTPDDRKRAVILVGIIFIMALLDMIGVASIMPFIAVLTNSQLIETNNYLSTFYRASGYLGVTNNSQFLIFLGGLVFVMLILSLSFKAITNYLQFRFINVCEFNISKKFMEGYLNQPYSWFLNRHSADLGKGILSDVSALIDQSIQPLIILFVYGSVSISLLVLIFLIDPFIAIIVLFVLGITYGTIFKLIKGFLSRIGAERFHSNQDRFIAVSEAFGAFKEVKIGGHEEFFIKKFSKPAETYAKNQASAQVISTLPRFLIEAIAFGGMILLILFLMSFKKDLSSVLSIISVYVFAGYRLMPALQQVYWSLSQLRFSKLVLDTLNEEILGLQYNQTKQSGLAPVTLKQAIVLNNIQYTYPNTTQPVLKNMSLNIPAHSIVGLTGVTGSGKTTTVDLILGLLEAEEGTLAVDGKIINANNRRHWQQIIGYVPQRIYLTDQSIAANIAFGVKPNDIKQNAVELAAKIANLHNFIINDLPKGYDTTVGERGVRLSGGQIQRIGIARALYQNPQVLVLDEATNALDGLTEQAVMEAIYNIGYKITIILIAHRLNTMKKCDRIYFLEKGQVKAQGTYKYLAEKNETFREMVNSIEKDKQL
jgi:ABC-type multidrug transport system fused ATPase/permease subunit